ncbi:MAG: bifunctional oligoribonuclease/PAP phosphatase NrnA [Mycoplasmataceae bacterium]|nr:bifunctional oligoribonuclease/PAP phosphatase NrnA [Mycoplasmataceae bacterium]
MKTKIANLINESEKIVLFHHVMPDGDSLSSSYGLLLSLKKKYPNKEIKWVADTQNIKRRFSFLNITFEDVIQNVDESYLAIVGDTSVASRVYGYDQYEKAGKKVCFDHHTNELDFKVDLFWSEPEYPASAIQAFEISEELGIKKSSREGIMSLYGILTDTGFFKYSLNDPKPLEFAAKLMKSIDRKELDTLYQNMNRVTEKSIKINNKIMGNYKKEGQLVYSYITKEEVKEARANATSFNRPNSIGNIGDSLMWILFVEYDDYTRVEYRSLGLPVNEIAKHFGGGGHIRASGCRIEPIDKDKAKEIIEYSKMKIEEYKKSNK